MALTEAEQQLLAELEATLTAQDPKLVSKFEQAPKRVHLTHAVGGVLGFLAGLVALVVGMSAWWWISVLGFVVMLISAVYVVSAWTKNSGPAKTSASGEDTSETLMDRLEQRWRDRQGP